MYTIYIEVCGMIRPYVNGENENILVSKLEISYAYAVPFMKDGIIYFIYRLRLQHYSYPLF